MHWFIVIKKHRVDSLVTEWHNQEQRDLKLSTTTGTPAGKTQRVSSYSSQFRQVHNDASLAGVEYFISAHQSQKGASQAWWLVCDCAVTVFICSNFPLKWTLHPCGQMTASCSRCSWCRNGRTVKLGSSWVQRCSFILKDEEEEDAH